jgi:hypothetical protein
MKRQIFADIVFASTNWCKFECFNQFFFVFQVFLRNEDDKESKWTSDESLLRLKVKCDAKNARVWK